MKPLKRSKARTSLVKFVLITVGALIVAGLAGAQAGANALARLNPILAAAIAPWDGQIAGRLASLKYALSAAQTADPRNLKPDGVTTELARVAYRKEPLNPAAVALIVSTAPDAKRYQLYHLAARLSRRDPLLQSKILEQEIARSDLTGSLRTLNQILAVRTDIRDQIIDQLVPLLQQRDAPEGFYGLLKDGPDWTNQFLTRAAEDGNALDNLITLRRKLPSRIIAPDADLALVNRLISAKRIGDAYALYRQLPQRKTSEPGAWSSDVPPLDWSLANTGELRAQVVGGSNVLTIDVRPGSSGTLATRILPTPHQPMRLTAQFSGSQSTQVGLSAEAICFESRQRVSSGRFVGGKLAMTIPAAPANCEFLVLHLDADGESLSSPAEIHLQPLHIEAVR